MDELNAVESKGEKAFKKNDEWQVNGVGIFISGRGALSSLNK